MYIYIQYNPYIISIYQYNFYKHLRSHGIIICNNTNIMTTGIKTTPIDILSSVI